MNKIRVRSTIVAGFLLATLAIGFYLGRSTDVGSDPIALIGTANAATATGAPEPTAAVEDRDVYYPGSEALAPDEMRVVACGTGMPNARPKQAAACWLVELGNGDKFIFDIGTASADRLSAMKIPYDYLDKVFIGHLHADHFGDLDALWIGGVLANRQVPLRVWGPSGREEKHGTKYAVDHMIQMYQWDWASRQGNVNTKGFQIEVNEFDYKGINQVIYEENGVTIRSIPAVHALDGPVSFILEWNGYKFAFSSDTYPNKWWLEHAQDADLAIHECFFSTQVAVEKQGWPVADALNVGTQVHTSPQQFGKVMSQIEPRLAVAYHVFNDFDTEPGVREAIRQTYSGPLSISVDYMVYNVTRDDIRVRMAVHDEDIWPQPSITEKLPADPNDKVGFSEFINSGRVVYSEVLQQIYDDANEMYGTDYEPPK